MSSSLSVGLSETYPNRNPRDLWLLDPQIAYLNHGAFGACPIPILELQQRLRSQLEREPVRFMERELEPLLDRARRALADFVGTDPSHLAFVPNATTGVNAVLRSLSLSPEDELLATDQEYNACRNALNYISQRTGAKIAIASVPFPLTSPQQIVEAVLARVSSKTKLVLLDHITSQTGLIFPIRPLIAQLTSFGIQVLVDGAHAPGQVPLNLRELGATYYTGNCHKWLCAPKGAAFLYVHPDRQAQVRPLTISHGANATRQDKSRFHLEFDWMGTDDPTAYLCLPEVIEFMGSLLPGGWSELMQRNHNLVLAARQWLCEALKVDLPCPDEMIGSMACVPLPDGEEKPLRDTLFDQYGIEVPIMPFPAFPKRLLRVSAQIYNTPEEYQALASAIAQI
ncbi:MAG: aminotransferase class V-fold PLP-dependent enzyme [Desertifilum sp. SIO1I2]|nr:aminotransferase class V-fold PLP-dependent enzyme [Desertifilum sp. SIO1I2]